MEKVIQIPEWQMKEIENTLRMANNIHHSHKKETCFDRCVCKSWEYAKEALENAQNHQNIFSGAVTIGAGNLSESLQFEEIHRFVKDQKNVVIISGHNLPPANILAEIVQGVKEKHPEFFNTDKAFSEPMSLLKSMPEIPEINYQFPEKKKGHERPYKFHR